MGSIFDRPYSPPKPIRHLNKVEEGIHSRVCKFIRQELPGVMFRTDGGGLHLSKAQAGKYKSLQYGSGWPDLFIPVPKRGYHGLFLELKQEGTSIYLKIGPDKGQLVTNPHIRQQAAVLSQLNADGYFARFCVGEDKAKQLINWYFDRRETLPLFDDDATF